MSSPKLLLAAPVFVFSSLINAQPITGTYDSSHPFPTNLGKVSDQIHLTYRSFDNSIAMTACEYHCQTEYLNNDRVNDQGKKRIYKSLSGNRLIQLNNAQWLYLTKDKQSRLFTLEDHAEKNLYSLKTAEKKVRKQHSVLFATVE
ncbi:hypothetical protein [Bacterioplanoides sp.]|uniref:hypothetical protein n=1 Tax=Bacterioplanoides sp. TaxID=2066072 RepID=UPI003B5A60E7